MATVQFSAVLVCCAYFLSSSSASLSHQEDLEQLNGHATYISYFPCLHPQVKVIPVHKLLPNSKTLGKAYFPDVTVLHQCNECTGSCISGHTCTAKKYHVVKLPFKATYLVDHGEFHQRDWQMEYHEVWNHTECACGVKPHHDYQGKSDEQPPMSAPPTPSLLDNVSGSGQRPAYNSSLPNSVVYESTTNDIHQDYGIIGS